MKSVFALFLLISFIVRADIGDIRKLYTKAENSESVSQELLTRLAAVTKDGDKTLVAYKGASITLKSKFSKKIADKISNFKEGARLIEYAEGTEPENIEIRLVRLSVQESVPAIVNYRKNIKEDKDFIIAHYKAQSDALKEYVANFIKLSKSFTAAEKQDINN